MSLYDDDIITDKSAAGWASGIKFMQNQLAFKKATITAPKRDQYRKRASDKLPPVIDLNARKDDDENTPPPYFMSTFGDSSKAMQVDSSELEWKFANEYDPHWPNEYEKVVKDMKDKKRREDDEKRKQEREERKKRDGFSRDENFSRPRTPEEDEERERPRRTMGAAIAPPPSLDDSPPNIIMPQKASSSYSGCGSSVAAKIMAKYGFKEGQGLGKSQQGIVKALEVEKTSKRGGRIVSEEGGGSPPPPPSLFSFNAMPPPPVPVAKMPEKPDNISTLLKNPSKVAILLNMVGPGEVDDDLEPEVRDECTVKYGPVTQVVIFEIPMAPIEEAVRIYVEFQRVDSAIKAVIDLNGRFFGGRLVRAGFYNYEDFKACKLNEVVPL